MTALRAPRFFAVTAAATVVAGLPVVGCSDDGTLSQTGFGTADSVGSTGETGAVTITMSSSISEGATDSDTADDTESTTGDPTTASTTASTSASTTSATTTTDTEVTATIYEIQDGSIGPGTAVLVEGVIVTGARDGVGMYVQESGGGEYSGIYVDTGDHDLSGLSVGDVVDITGVTAEPTQGGLADLTQIDASAGTITDTGADMPPTPQTVALSVLGDPVMAEPWEGVLVTVSEAAPVDVSMENNFNEFQLSDGSDAVWVDDFLFNIYDDAGTFPDMGVGATFTSVTGPLNYTFGDFKLAPRTAADLVGYTPGGGGMAVSVETLSAGDLVVTEVMYDPAQCNDTDCEWIEIYNASGSDVNLNGLIIGDASGATDTVSESQVIADGTYAVIGQTPWGYQTFSPTVEMNMPPFNNNNGTSGTADRVIISNSGGVLDETADWTVPGNIAADDGHSWKLDVAPNANANDTAGNWCYSDVTFEGNDFGSPGAANPNGCATL